MPQVRLTGQGERTPHPENDLTAQLQLSLDGQDSSTSVMGRDNPGRDAMKGAKTTDAIKSGNQV